MVRSAQENIWLTESLVEKEQFQKISSWEPVIFDPKFSSLVMRLTHWLPLKWTATNQRGIRCKIGQKQPKILPKTTPNVPLLALYFHYDVLVWRKNKKSYLAQICRFWSSITVISNTDKVIWNELKWTHVPCIDTSLVNTIPWRNKISGKKF